MGKTKRLMGMTNDRGTGIVVLQLKGPGRTVCGGVPSPMGVAESRTWDKAKEGIHSVLSSIEQYTPTLLFPFCSRSRS